MKAKADYSKLHYVENVRVQTVCL